MTSDATIRDDRGPGARGLHFPLQQGERVLAVCRRHWLFLWPRLTFMTLVALAPVVIIALLMASTDTYEGAARTVFWIASGVWLLYWAVRIFFTWYRYNHDIWVVTDQRIVDSVKTTPFSLKMSTADLVNVQDMTVERNGILRTMFDFGDIVCQTASEQSQFVLAGIPHPAEVQALVDRERDRERRR